MSVSSRIPKSHFTPISYVPNEIIRREGSGFFLPPAKGMREPGTNYMTIITSNGAMMVESFDPTNTSQYLP